MSYLLRENMPNAYKEVYEILKYVDKRDLESIPDTFIKLVETKMNKDYIYHFDYTKEFGEQEMLLETKAILGHIFLKYWATDYEREVIQKKLDNDIRIHEEEKAQNYDPKSIFASSNNKSSITDDVPKEEINGLIEIDDSFFKRIFQNIKKFFKK